MKKKKKVQEKRFESKEIKKNRELNSDYKTAIGFFVVLAIVAGLFGLLYFFTGKYVKKDEFQTTTTSTTTVEFDESTISVANVFKQKDKEYYCLFYDKKDKTHSMYDTLLIRYTGSVPMYTIDLSNAMNKKNYDKSGSENTKPTNASEIMITRPTLIHIKDNEVIEYITDRDKIAEKFA